MSTVNEPNASGAPARPDSGKPLIFISHRHKNDGIAKILTDFIEQTCLGEVEVFCSSRAENALAPGDDIPGKICEKLSRAKALALIYTSSDDDWSYCMYECGLVTDPRTPTTRIVVFQCGTETPRVYFNIKAVDIRNDEDIKSFVLHLLTDPNFFPGLNKAIAPGVKTQPKTVSKFAETLARDLVKAAPPLPDGDDDSWPSFDSMTLEISLNDMNTVLNGVSQTDGGNGGEEPTSESDADEASSPSDANGVSSPDSGALKESCKVRQAKILEMTRVIGSDKHCLQLFGRRQSFSDDCTLNEVTELWRENNPNQDDAWIRELARQIIRVSGGAFPMVRFVGMSSRNRGDEYIPTIHRVRRLAAKQTMQFEVYFVPILKGAN